MDKSVTMVGNLDKYLTKLRQITKKLDKDWTWTKLGQILDKIWTNIGHLSKHCPNTRSTPVPSFFVKLRVVLRVSFCPHIAPPHRNLES